MVNKKDQLQESSEKFLEKSENRCNLLFEKWARNDIGRGDATIDQNVDIVKIMESNPSKARLIAQSLENEERHLSKLSETIIQSTFSTTPENLLKIVKKGVANSCRSEMFQEVALDTTDDALYFIDMTHEATLTGRQPTADDEIFENAYEFTAGETAYKDTDGTATDTYSVTLDEIPIKPSKVFITLDDKMVGYDDGSSVITAVSVNSGTTLTSGTVNYTTGVVALVFDANVPATSSFRIMYHWDSEQSSLYAQYPKVSLTISKKRFKARPMPLGYTYSAMAELVLETQLNESASDLLVNAVAAEHARSKDFKAISYARSVAKSNASYEFSTKFADAGEVSHKSHAQRITGVIDNIGAQIHDQYLRGQVTTIIAGSQAASYLRLHDLWREDTSQPREGVYKAGMLGDKDVFVCPASPNSGQLVATNEMLLTYKNPLQPLDVSIAFGVLTELSAALNYPQFYTDGNIASVEDRMLISGGFIRLLTLTNLDSYVV